MGIGVTLALAIALAAQVMDQPVPETMDPPIEAGATCTADKNLCLSMTQMGEENTDTLMVQITSDVGVGKTYIEMPASIKGTYDTMSVWPQVIALGKNPKAAPGSQSALIGIIGHRSSMYSGGGGGSKQLHLFRIRNTAGVARLEDELLSLPLHASLLIRACFSEEDYEKRREACHDEYDYDATLTVLQKDISTNDMPILEYKSTATAYPRTSRRSRDNSGGRRLRKADLVTWKDPQCSYSRTLRYNPATQKYEMNRPAPNCSDYIEI